MTACRTPPRCLQTQPGITRTCFADKRVNIIVNSSAWLIKDCVVTEFAGLRRRRHYFSRKLLWISASRELAYGSIVIHRFFSVSSTITQAFKMRLVLTSSIRKRAPDQQFALLDPEAFHRVRLKAFDEDLHNLAL